jgi:deoxyribodipyrimidine photo-lyase
VVAKSAVLWWVRRDLRLGDNPALAAGAQAGDVLPVFVLDPRLWEAAGANRRAFLVACLEDLDRRIGGHLVVRYGRPDQEIPQVAGEAQATAVYAAADFGPYGRERDRAVEAALAARKIEAQWIGTPYAVEPGSVVKGDGTAFRVFTPFARAWADHGRDRPMPEPADVGWLQDVRSDGLPDAPATDAVLPAAGEAAALRRWEQFKATSLDHYGERRDIPAGDHTSRLSAYLKWGCVHPRTLLADLDLRMPGHRTFRNELCWREFYADVLYRQPASARHSLQANMAKMKVDHGRQADERFEAWAAGMTGYPIVDAGMRQLVGEGWMHNRVRMIVASFLVKDLHVDWTRGARHFLRHLVDGDLASNSHGWQWVAGTGTDAAPYYRVFNPILQGRKFDPDGAYIRAWVPELASMPAADIHEPWAAKQPSFDAAGYPAPIVDHAEERDEALARYQATRQR